MDISKETIGKIQELVLSGVEPREITVGERRGIAIGDHVYWNDRKFPTTLQFHTLSGIAEYVNRCLDCEYITGAPIIQVETEDSVSYYSGAFAPLANRCILASARPRSVESFPFGRFMPCEEFIIKLQALFVPDRGDWQEVVGACAGIKKQDGVEYKDSGVTQKVVVQSGLSLSTMKELPNPVVLAPYRTFPEIEQPESSFVLRVTDGRSGPELALFEADGGAWKLTAMERIKNYLKEEVSRPEMIIIA